MNITYIPPSWDELFMRHVYLIASKSKDKHTKIGAVLIKNNRVISEGYNGICSGVDDNIPERHERPEKYIWYEHAERNCIYSAAKFGISTEGCSIYINALPCPDCCRGIIQCGIKNITVHKQWMDYEKSMNRPQWNKTAIEVRTMLAESNIKIDVFDFKLGIIAYLDGKEINI